MAESTTYKQDQALRDAIIEHLGDMSWLFELIGEIAEPDDVFNDSQLEVWALENGFVRAE